MTCREIRLPLLCNLNEGLSAEIGCACRQHGLKPVNGLVYEDFAAASSAAAVSTPGVQSAEAQGVNMPKTPCGGVAAQPTPAITGQPSLPGPTAPSSEAATTAARKRQAPIGAAQEGPSVPTTVASQQDGVTGVGGEAGVPATTQPAQRRRKMQDSRVDAVIDLDDSSEGGVQARQQQLDCMTDGAPDIGPNAISQCVSPDKR